MDNVEQFTRQFSEFANLDFEEVYVDERYKHTEYKKIESFFDQFVNLVKTLEKDVATKLLVSFLKASEKNIESRYLITCDYRMYAAIESAKSADDVFNRLEDLKKQNLSDYVKTEHQKIVAIIERMQAIVSQFMITKRNIVVYKRKDASEYSPATLTISPSEIVDFDPTTYSNKIDWKTRFHTFSNASNIPTTKEFDEYILQHRIVKEYIKNEPKSKSMYLRKGFEKTYAYIKEVKQVQKIVKIVLALVIIGAIVFFFVR